MGPVCPALDVRGVSECPAVSGGCLKTVPAFARSQSNALCDVFMPLGGTDYVTKRADIKVNGARMSRPQVLRCKDAVLHDVDRPDIMRAVAEAEREGVIGNVTCQNGERQTQVRGKWVMASHVLTPRPKAQPNTR